MIIIGYYTTDSVYQDSYELLEKSLERVGHRFDYKAIPPSDWKSVTDLKPRVVLEKLQQYQEPVLYLDADAFVHENLDKYFEDKNCDIAVNYLKKKNGEEELLSGTVYFDYNNEVLQLVQLWIKVGVDNPELNDQQSLQKAVSEYNGELSVFRLSPAFTYIFDWEYPDVEKPIIEHMQASREVYCIRRMSSPKNKLKKMLGLKISKEAMLSRRRRRVAELQGLLRGE